MSFSEFMVGQFSYDCAALLMRLAVGVALLPFAIKKCLSFDDPPKTFPQVLWFTPEAGFYVAMIIETGASVCVILGLFTRLIAFPAIVNMAFATRVTKGKYFTSPAQAYLLGFIAILIIGPGKYSLDWLFF